jgi:hypothetical protein
MKSEHHSPGQEASALEVRSGAAAPPARSAGEDGRGGEAASRLDKRTYLDREQGRWSIRTYDYGGGLGEVGWSFVGSILVPKSSRGEAEDRAAHETRAVRRARSQLRRLVLAANADRLLTLTYRENVTDLRQAGADLARFVRRVRARLPLWVYIAVPERQKRGAWHWHLAVVGRQDVEQLRSDWRRLVGDGNIDVQQPKSRSTNRRLALVRYLGKYLAKGFEEGDRELSGHRYRASLGIEVPSRSIEVPQERLADVSAYALEQLRLQAGTVGYVWADERALMGWACSWE